MPLDPGTDERGPVARQLRDLLLRRVGEPVLGELTADLEGEVAEALHEPVAGEDRLVLLVEHGPDATDPVRLAWLQVQFVGAVNDRVLARGVARDAVVLLLVARGDPLLLRHDPSPSTLATTCASTLVRQPRHSPSPQSPGLPARSTTTRKLRRARRDFLRTTEHSSGSTWTWIGSPARSRRSLNRRGIAVMTASCMMSESISRFSSGLRS